MGRAVRLSLCLFACKRKCLFSMRVSVLNVLFTSCWMCIHCSADCRMCATSVKNYAVVLFESNEPEVVPFKWTYVDENKKSFCYFPSRSVKSSLLKRLISDCTEPDTTTWQLFPCRILYTTGLFAWQLWLFCNFSTKFKWVTNCINWLQYVVGIYRPCIMWAFCSGYFVVNTW